MTLWTDARNVLSLDRRAAGRACLHYYLASGTAGMMLLTSVFLLLPILRDAGSRGGSLVHYALPLPTGEALNLSLHWAAPFALLMLASWGLALSKRVEYQLWHTGYAAARVYYREQPQAPVLRNASMGSRGQQAWPFDCWCYPVLRLRVAW